MILQLELVLQSCDFPARAGNAIYSCSWKPVLRVLDLYYKVAIFQLELEPCTSRTRLVLQSRDFPARARSLYFAYLCFAYYTYTTKSRYSSWSWKPVLRTLDWRYKVAIFELELDFAYLCFAYQTYNVANFQLELEACTSHVGLVLQYYKVAIFKLRLALQSCDFPTRTTLLSDTSEHNF